MTGLHLALQVIAAVILLDHASGVSGKTFNLSFLNLCVISEFVKECDCVCSNTQ